jgi:lipopolysaccharide transport system permease protein
MTLILTVVLGSFTRLPLQESEIPYNLIVLSGMVSWIYFSKVLGGASNSVLANFSLYSKVYLPRIILPAVPAVVGFVDLVVLSIVFLGLAIFQGVVPTFRWLLMPFFYLLLFGFTLGLGLWFSALNVPYRDVGRMLPLLLQIGFYASPIIYPFSLIKPPLSWFAMLNPIVGVVSFARWMFFNQNAFPFVELIVTIAASVLLLISGAFVFRRIEDQFVDIG